MQSASNHTITRLSVSVLIVGVLASSDCNRIVGNRKPLSAEVVCRQIKGTFTPPNFCRVMNSDPFWSHFPTDLPDDWICANPPYDKDPHYGSCTDPKTKKFDSNYCFIPGVPKEGCSLVPRPRLK